MMTIIPTSKIFIVTMQIRVLGLMEHGTQSEVITFEEHEIDLRN